MLARTRPLKHPTGFALNSPILIPSFSSKGFHFDKDGKSEVDWLLRSSLDYMTECVLISAYDLGVGHLRLSTGIPWPQLVFLDSGGYETSDAFDLSTVKRPPTWRTEGEWNVEKLRGVYDSWPSDDPAVFTSYDTQENRVPIAHQIENAHSLLDRYRSQLRCILLKPEDKENRYLSDDTIENILAQVDDLGDFDTVGLTEAELGSSVLARMERITRMRTTMDSAGVDAMIHVFGGLDPLTTCLYFMAGAEIFDGLTWLRYSYWDDTAIYPRNWAVLALDIGEEDNFADAQQRVANIYYLQDLHHRMKKLAEDEDLSVLQWHRDAIEKAHLVLCEKLLGRHTGRSHGK